MSKLSELLQQQTTNGEQHPKARYWSEILESGEAASIECEFKRPREPLGFGRARLFVTLRDRDGQPLGPPDEADWDPELDADLLALGCRAGSPANEAERAGMMFGSRFSQLEAEYGPAWFIAVLVKEIGEVFAGEPKVEEKLKAVHEYEPSTESKAYARAVGAIDGVIEGRGHALTRKLGYSAEEAKAILDEAMAWFLDDKFMITTRQSLGFSE